MDILCIYRIDYVLNYHIDLFDDFTNMTIKNTYNNFNCYEKEHYTHLIVYEDFTWMFDNLMDLS